MSAATLWVPNRALVPVMLGQPRPAPSVQPESRIVPLSRTEAEMLVRVVKGVLEFARGFPLEFHAYCPMERWEPVLEKVGRGMAAVEDQLEREADPVFVDGEFVFSAVDLEECTSGARTARLDSAKLAMYVAAAGGIAQALFGVKWLALPVYAVSLAIVLGPPLIEHAKEVPSEPFRPEMAGLHGNGDPEARAKVIERVQVDRTPARYWWGEVAPGKSARKRAVCLAQQDFRIRVEGWEDDRVTPGSGWTVAPLSACASARHEILVWDVQEGRRDTGYPPVPESSGSEHTYWVEYTGPLTDGAIRRAGPFCCTVDSRAQAQDDAGLKDGDGFYVIYDEKGSVVEEGP